MAAEKQRSDAPYCRSRPNLGVSNGFYISRSWIVTDYGKSVPNSDRRELSLYSYVIEKLGGGSVDKPSAYVGEDPFVFVCYAHEDSPAVYLEIAWLQAEGVNLWYDEGISLGSEWTEALAGAIQRCTKFLFFVTPNSVTREHCRRELSFAQEEERDVMAVHLQLTEASSGLRLSLNNRQAIFKHELTQEQYDRELLQAIAGASKEPAAQPIVPTSSRIPRVAILGVAALVIAIAVAWLRNVGEDASFAGPAEVEQRAGTDVLYNSIAVLPFENLSPDPDNAYFAAGIHEEILNQLGKIRDLSVIGRTSVQNYVGATMSIPVIGKELNVESVMEGSVRYADNRVRITTQLLDARTGAQLWAEAYDRKLKDIFAIQSDIALEITRAMKAQFSLAEQTAIAAAPTDDLNAYAHYIRAMALFGQSLRLQPVLAELDAAVSLDEDFALALATKAYLHGVLSVLLVAADAPLTPEGARENVLLAELHAEDALAIDPSQGLAYLALALADVYHGRTTSRWEHSSMAYDRNPNHPFVLFEYGRSNLEQGLIDAAVQAFERAIASDPKNLLMPWFAGSNMRLAGVWDVAKIWAAKTVELSPDSEIGYLLTGQIASDEDDAATMQRMVELLERFGIADPAAAGGLDRIRLISMMQFYRRLGRKDDVARLHAVMLEIDQALPLNNGELAAIHLALGDTDESMHYLNLVADEHFPADVAREVQLHPDHPQWESLREHPGFEQLLGKLENREGS